jgi:hypothetical protein
MDLSKVALKVKNSSTLLGDSIGYVGDLVLTDIETVTAPFGYVVQGATTASENRGETHVSQILTDNMSIFVVLRSHRHPTAVTGILNDRLGTKAILDINILREQFLSALLGLIVNNDYWPLSYVGDTICFR